MHVQKKKKNAGVDDKQINFIMDWFYTRRQHS